jgi:DNA-3-methyladenine glycosylase II
VLRGTGFPDVLPMAAPRIRAEVAGAYGLDAEPDDARLLEIAEPWRPFRSWVCLLLRATP